MQKLRQYKYCVALSGQPSEPLSCDEVHTPECLDSGWAGVLSMRRRALAPFLLCWASLHRVTARLARETQRVRGQTLIASANQFDVKLRLARN